jgi:hypothetical protein
MRKLHPTYHEILLSEEHKHRQQAQQETSETQATMLICFIINMQSNGQVFKYTYLVDLT